MYPTDNMYRLTYQNKPSGAGIYLIISKATGFRYIGSSSNVGKRCIYNHYNSLKQGIHPNQRLQNHVEVYGIDDLLFYVLEYCKRPVLEAREQFYIDQWKPEFNLSSIVTLCARRNSRAAIEKANATRIENFNANQKIKSTWGAK